MQKLLFDRSDVDTNFKGYFKSETKFSVPQKFENNIFLFEDYHRTISNYFNLITDSGFKVEKMDECKPIKTKNKDINKFLSKYSNFSLYFIFDCKK